MRELTPGTVVGLKYIVRERLGEGGMGAVYRADEPILARSVAIKVLKPELASDAALVRRLRNEAVAASRVQHPGSIAVVSAFYLPAPLMALIRAATQVVWSRG